MEFKEARDILRDYVLCNKSIDRDVRNAIESLISIVLSSIESPYKSEISKKIEKALSIAFQYGQIDGNHHKMWTIDQMVRTLIGNDKHYDLWVHDYSYDTETGEEYLWDTGIAP